MVRQDDLHDSPLMMQNAPRIERLRYRIGSFALLCAVTAAMAGCATGGVTSSVFVDPSRYDLYDCKQLATERVAVNKRVVDLELLMAKAETGAGGALVSGLAYQSEYAQEKARRDLVDQKILSNNCQAEPPPVVEAPKPVTKKKRKQ